MLLSGRCSVSGENKISLINDRCAKLAEYPTQLVALGEDVVEVSAVQQVQGLHEGRLWTLSAAPAKTRKRNGSEKGRTF